MKKEEYIERKKSLQQQLQELAEEYIKTNITLPVGTKVRVTQQDGKRVRVGVVKDNIIVGDSVLPFVMQLTNAGEESLRRIVVGENDGIEILEE